MKEILEQLREMLPNENFHMQPYSAEEQLLKLEKKYKISTFDFINKKKDISHIPLSDQDDWINILEVFILFGGCVKPK